MFRSVGLLRLMEMPPDRLCGFARDYGGEGLGGGLLDVAKAAEMS